MTKSSRTYYRYSNCFKEKVVQEVSSGSSISSVRLKYGICGANTVQGWIKKFGREELLNTVVKIEMKGETDGIKRLRDENRRLKEALADATLARNALESLVAVADIHYQTDLKKNFGTQRSVTAGRRKEER
jgi:transposase-like protein